jgi:hypothetical protein
VEIVPIIVEEVKEIVLEKVPVESLKKEKIPEKELEITPIIVEEEVK